MNSSEKLLLLEDLLTLKQKLTAVAQKSNESTYCFGRRVLSLLKSYKIAGSLAQLELEEVTESLKEREELAIVCFVVNLRRDIKRYMCQPELYTSLQQAVNHAEKISFNLQELQNLRQNTNLNINPLN